MPSPRRLLLIDAYSNIFRAFYAIRELTNAEGLPTNAVYGFIQMLRKLLHDEQPELVGAAFDVADEETVRRQTYAEYKANRPETPADLIPQIPWIRRALTAYRIPILEHPGWEADDVLGTLSRAAAEAGHEVVLVSSDKDLLQLVGPRVKLFHTGRGKLYGPAEVEEDLGVPPERVVDVMALTGDTVDNVPGVPGIGKKGAPQLIREFGSLEELLERAGEVLRKSYREGLEEHRDQALLSKELVTVRCDLPIALDVTALQLEEPDAPALREIFAELGFVSLLEELAGEMTGSEEGLPDVEEAADPDAWKEAAHRLTGPLRMVTVGEHLLAVQATDGEATVAVADLREEAMAAAVAESLSGWLSDAGRHLVGHDLKPLVRTSGARTVTATLDDTLLQAYLLRPAGCAATLEQVALERLGSAPTPLAELGWDAAGRPPELGDPAREQAAGEHLAILGRLAAHLQPELEASPGLTRVYREIEMPLMPVLAAMERRGIGLDVKVLEGLSAEFGAELEELEQQVFAAAGHEFNLNSPKQLGEVLFEQLGLPVIRKTRKTKNYSTDAATLEELAARGHEIASTLLRYRELAKLKSTYVDALPQLVGEDGRLHTEFQQAVAATGRLSSADPNLQNIPVRTADGRRIRRAFVAPEGRLLLVADYSQIELRILAHISGDEALIASFEAGQDIHAATAASVFGVAPDLVTGAQRRVAKMINFGILYGMTPFGLAQRLGIPRGDAEQFIETYMGRYPGIQGYIQETLEKAEESGQVETLYGRIRPLPEIRAKNPARRENARRMAINAPIQGTAADLLKLAMIHLDRRLADEAAEATLLLTVHDELVVEVPDRSEKAITEMVRAEMEGVADLAVPLEVGTGSGRSWYDAKGE